MVAVVAVVVVEVVGRVVAVEELRMYNVKCVCLMEELPEHCHYTWYTDIHSVL
jgi:hypothetical protein